MTRYQWPRIIAAKTPPIAALTTTSWTSSADRAERTAAPRERPEDERRDGGRGRLRSRAPSRRAARTRRATRPPATRMQNSARAARRGASQLGSTTTGEDTSDAGQRPVGDPGEDPEADRAQRREAQVAGRRARPAAEHDDRRERPEREPGQDRPVDEGEVLADLGGGHGPSVAAVVASAPEVSPMSLGRDTTFTWYGHACVEVQTPGGKTDPVRSVVRQPEEHRRPPTRSRPAT